MKKRASVAVAVAAFAVLTVAPATAAAEQPSPSAPGRVRMLESSAVSPRARRCLTRVREELAAGGFEVTVSEFGTGGEGLWIVDPPSSRGRPNAAIALIGNPDAGDAELWIVEGVPSGRVVLRRLPIPPGAGAHDDEVLAIRTLEFLRASALDLGWAAPASSNPPPGTSPPSPAPATLAAAAGQPVAPPVSSVARGPISFELGLALMNSPRGLDPAFLPVARVRAEWLSLLETRVAFAGFGTEPRVTNPEGTASVGQTEILLELRTAFRHGRALRPVVGVGGGLLRVNVEGVGKVPFEGREGLRWVGLFDVGAGFTARLSGQLSLAVEVHGQLAAPHPTVTFSGQEAARIGRPAIFSSVTLVVPL